MSNHSRRLNRNSFPTQLAKRSAFTLIEILLACILASMLSVVMVQVMRTTMMESRRVAMSRQLFSETWLLREQLANDLGNARGFKITRDSLILGGFLASDPKTGTRTQQLALVTYRLVENGNQKGLQRSERWFATPQASPSPEIVWYGVGGMVVLPKSEMVGKRPQAIAELEQLGLTTSAGGIVFRLTDEKGDLLVEIL